MRVCKPVALLLLVLALGSCADTDQRDDAVDALLRDGGYTESQARCLVDAVEDRGSIDILEPGYSLSAEDVAVVVEARRVCVPSSLILTPDEFGDDPDFDDFTDIAPDEEAEIVEQWRSGYVESLVVDGGLDSAQAGCIADLLIGEFGLGVGDLALLDPGDLRAAERLAASECSRSG